MEGFDDTASNFYAHINAKQYAHGAVSRGSNFLYSIKELGVGYEFYIKSSNLPQTIQNLFKIKRKGKV
mgnify:CR=1 FL=1